jgi:uncharacterized protein YjbI with pentapeptide repeats
VGIELEQSWEDRIENGRRIRRRYKDFYIVGGGLLIVCLGLWAGWHLFAQIRGDYQVNVWTSLIDFVLTVVVINQLNEVRAKKQLREQLMRELGSSDNALALRALRELRAHEWVNDSWLQRAFLESANLRRAVFNGADLREAWCISANLEEAQMWGTNLQGAILWSAALPGANLGLANLVEVRALDADFQGAELGQADIHDATMINANFRDANMWAVNLQGADLNNADLRGSNLNQANLQDANTTNVQLDEKTRLPNGELWSASEYPTLACFTDPNRDDFWRPGSDNLPWWIEGGVPRSLETVNLGGVRRIFCP